MPYSRKLREEVLQAIAALDSERASLHQLGEYDTKALARLRHTVYKELRAECVAQPSAHPEKKDRYWEIHHRLACEYEHIRFPAADGHKGGLPSTRLAHKFANEDMECMATALSAASARKHANPEGRKYTDGHHHRHESRPTLTTR